MIEIPFKSHPSFIEDVLFDKIVYRLKFVWNTKGSFWTISFFDLLDNPIVTGIKLVINFDLLRQYHNESMPKGKLFVIDAMDNKNEPGRYDFENNRQLSIIYIEENEII